MVGVSFQRDSRVKVERATPILVTALLLVVFTWFRPFTSAFLGLVVAYVTYCISYWPLEIVWDLDHTLLWSVCPLSEGEELTEAEKLPASSWFDQIDDDYEYEENIPNTRTFWRPWSREVLSFLSYCTRQHVFTAAQESYTKNILEKLDPNQSLFRTVIHRDLPEYNHKKGKNLLIAVPASQLRRTILFDDRPKNFDPQPRNGIQVRTFQSLKQRDVEMLSLLFISLILVLIPGDIRQLIGPFRSQQQMNRHAVAL